MPHPRVFGRLCAARDLGRCRFHDTVGRQELRWLQKMLQLRVLLFRRIARRGEVDRTVLSRDPARDRENRPHADGKFRRNDSERIGFAFDNLCATAFSVERIGERLLEGCQIDECRRHPYACRAGRLQDFNVRCHFERAPTAGRYALPKQAPRPREGEAR